MLTRGLLIAGLMAAAAMLTACAGQAPTATNTVTVPEGLTPDTLNSTPTAAPLTHSPPTSEPTPESAGRPSTAEGVSAVGQEAPTLSPTAGQVSTPAGMETATLGPESSTEDLAAIMRIVEAYWAALNDYEVDLAVTMLEDSYRVQEEDLIRKDIGRMKLFRVKLGVSVEKPLALNEAGDYEIYLKLTTPVDTRRVLMIFRRIDGDWMIVFSGEVD